MKKIKYSWIVLGIILFTFIVALIVVHYTISKGLDELPRDLIKCIPSVLRGENVNYAANYKNDRISKIKPNHLFVYFKDLEGLRSGDRVRSQGKVIGKSEIFRINSDVEKKYEVLIIFNDPNLKINSNSVFRIAPAGMNNERYIEIISPKNETPYLQKGSYVRGAEGLGLSPVRIPLDDSAK